MQTGQNSIAPENSLPQLGQVRWASVLTVLAALQLQAQPRARPGSTERREIGQHGPWQTIVAFHKEFRVSPTITVENIFRNKIPETWRPDCLCNGMKTPDHEQKLHLDGIERPKIWKTLDCHGDLWNLCGCARSVVRKIRNKRSPVFHSLIANQKS